MCARPAGHRGRHVCRAGWPPPPIRPLQTLREEDRGPGELSALVMARAMTAAETAETATPPAGIGPKAATAVWRALKVDSGVFVSLGDLILVKTDDGVIVLAVDSAGHVAPPDDGAVVADGLDARMMSVTLLGGQKVRTFGEALLELAETDWDDQGWPVKGACTVRPLTEPPFSSAQPSCQSAAMPLWGARPVRLLAEPPVSSASPSCEYPLAGPNSAPADNHWGPLASGRARSSASAYQAMPTSRQHSGARGATGCIAVGFGKAAGSSSVAAAERAEPVSKKLSKKWATLKEQRKLRVERVEALGPKAGAKGRLDLYCDRPGSGSLCGCRVDLCPPSRVVVTPAIG